MKKSIEGWECLFLKQLIKRRIQKCFRNIRFAMIGNADIAEPLPILNKDCLPILMFVLSRGEKKFLSQWRRKCQEISEIELRENLRNFPITSF